MRTERPTAVDLLMASIGATAAQDQPSWPWLCSSNEFGEEWQITSNEILQHVLAIIVLGNFDSSGALDKLIAKWKRKAERKGGAR